MRKQYIIIIKLLMVTLLCVVNVSDAHQDLSYWNCKLKLSTSCPNSDVKFFLYTSGHSKRRFQIDLKNKQSLHYSGWNPNKMNVIIIHGFNGAENQSHMTIIRNAYLKRGDFNVFTVDWMPLTRYPCYLSSLSNMRLVSLCAAQFYSHLTYSGASSFNIQCVGHSLGAHLCGMISNHLTLRQHKIIGLDPARPLVSMFSSDEFRLTRDDANVVEIIHTNIGMYGDTPRTGDVDFCVNGGRLQPVCSRESNIIRQGRCSHLTSTCYFAESLLKNRIHFLGIPCTDDCDTLLLPKNSKQIVFVPMGLHTPERAKGTFCVQYKISRKTCPFE